MNEDNTAAVVPHEGQELTVREDNGEETPSESRTEEDNQEESDPSPEGEDTQGEDKELPFHEHPRWKEREDEWNNRFNAQEVRHQDELKQAVEGIRKEFGDARKENNAPSKPPVWFGGTQDQWDAYKADRDTELKEAEERAVKRTIESLSKEVTDEEKATKDATDFLQTEVIAIQGDKTLNPSGAKIDPAKLFKTAFDNELIDSKGRWNYRAAQKILNGTSATTVAKPNEPKPKPANAEKKAEAAATASESGKETKPRTFSTSKDFEKDRPW